MCVYTFGDTRVCVPSSLQPNEYQGFLMNTYIKEVERDGGEEVMLRPQIEFRVIPGERCGLVDLWFLLFPL